MARTFAPTLLRLGNGRQSPNRVPEPRAYLLDENAETLGGNRPAACNRESPKRRFVRTNIEQLCRPVSLTGTYRARQNSNREDSSNLQSSKRFRRKALRLRACSVARLQDSADRCLVETLLSPVVLSRLRSLRVKCRRKVPRCLVSGCEAHQSMFRR